MSVLGTSTLQNYMELAARLSFDLEGAEQFQRLLAQTQDFAEDLQCLSDGDLSQAQLDEIDTDGDGEVSRAELAEFVSGGLERLTEDLETLLALLLGLDENGGESGSAKGAESGGGASGDGGDTEAASGGEGSEAVSGGEDPEATSGAAPAEGERTEETPDQIDDALDAVADALRAIADALRGLAGSDQSTGVPNQLAVLADQLEALAADFDALSDGPSAGIDDRGTTEFDVLAGLSSEVGIIAAQVESLSNADLI